MSETYTIGATNEAFGTTGHDTITTTEAEAIRAAEDIAAKAGHNWRPWVLDAGGNPVEIPAPTRKTRTITLTGRPPVKIVEGEWPVIARASGDSYHGHDHARRQQAETRNEIDTYRAIVRQHSDGRTLVYGVLSAAIAAWRQPARGEDWRGGVLLPSPDTSAIVTALHDIGRQSGIPDAVIRACIADLPAEML